MDLILFFPLQFLYVIIYFEMLQGNDIGFVSEKQKHYLSAHLYKWYLYYSNL
jgi:hypothetical protein